MLHPDTKTLMVLALNQIISKFQVSFPSLKLVVIFVLLLKNLQAYKVVLQMWEDVK